MDPILVKAVRSLLQQIDAAERAGIDFTPEKQEELVRARTRGKYGVTDVAQLLEGINTNVNPRNVTRSIAQGALFNFGDELVGMVSPDAKEEMRLRESLYAKQHPYANAIGQVAGGFAVPGMGAGATLGKGAVGVGKAMARGAAIGAGAGALAGAGAGEGELGDRLDHAETGAMWGGALGAAFPAAGGLLRMLSPTARMQRRVGGAIEDAGGVPVLQQRSREAAAAGRGADVMLADLDPHLQQLLDFAANNDVGTWVRATESLAKRQSGMSQRLLADVKRLLGSPHLKSEMRKMKSALADWASSDAGFEGLRKMNPKIADPEALSQLAQYLDQPYVKQLWEVAKQEGRVGVNPEGLFSLPSFERLHNFKTKLDREVTMAFTRGDGTFAKGLAGVRDQVDAAIQRAVPEYGRRAATYAKGINAQKALALGATYVRNSDNVELMNVVTSMAKNPSELEAFRKGFVAQLLQHLRRPANKNIAREVLNDHALQERMNIVFGDPQVFDEFMRGVAQEGSMARTAAGVGGSATHRRGMAMDADPAELVQTATNLVTTGPAGAAAAMANRRLPNVIARATARNVGPVAMTKGTPAIDALLARYASQGAPQGVPPWMQTHMPAALGVGGANLFSPPN